MKIRFSRTISTVATAIVLSSYPFADAAQAQDSDNHALAEILGGIASSLEATEQDKAIERAFEEVLDREPSERELRRYRSRMHEEHWTERDVREDLGGRDDYRRHSERAYEDPDRVIRRAYEDILHRDADEEGLRNYRNKMIDDDWTENDVREALRKSSEHDQISRKSAEKIVRRAYEDVLDREPDYNGLSSYANKVMDHGWDEHDVREALLKSPEYRQKNQMTRQQAEEIVARAYRGVLGREPDPGSRTYVDRVLRDHWSERDVARELRNSKEYRSKHR